MEQSSHDLLYIIVVGLPRPLVFESLVVFCQELLVFPSKGRTLECSSNLM